MYIQNPWKIWGMLLLALFVVAMVGLVESLMGIPGLLILGVASIVALGNYRIRR